MKQVFLNHFGRQHSLTGCRVLSLARLPPPPRSSTPPAQTSLRPPGRSLPAEPAPLPLRDEAGGPRDLKALCLNVLLREQGPLSPHSHSPPPGPTPAAQME